MRRTGKMRRKKQKQIIIISALSLLLMITVGYAAFSTNLRITAKGNVKEKSRVIQAWSSTDQTDFHSDYYKQNIVSATFLDNVDVPSNAAESWNVSEDQKHGGVMAWVVPNNEDSSKYDLYIGAKDGVIANEDSSYLFYNFTDIKTIDFQNNFDTTSMVNMEYMFYHCQQLINLDLQSFDTSNVINMHCLFDGCVSLETLNVNSFDTSSVTNMQQMFYGCYNLITLDLENFNTKNVTNMYYMFYACYRLEILNLCSFNTSNVINMGSMFRGTSKLTTIYVGTNWTTTQADTTDMFYGSGVSEVTTGQC